MIRFIFQVLAGLLAFYAFMFIAGILFPILTHPIVFSIWFGFLVLVIWKLVSRWINE